MHGTGVHTQTLKTQEKCCLRNAKAMESVRMPSEKTPALCQTKTPLEYDNPKKKPCSKATVAWLLTALLFVLLFVLTIEFLFSPFEQKIRVYDEQPIDVVMVPPKLENSNSKETNTVKVLNPWDFDFLIDPVNLCATLNPPNSVEYQNNPEVKLLMLVPSAVNHSEQRKAIRNTWGSVAEKQSGSMRLGFVIGTTTNKTLDGLIKKESLEYRDIIQVDYVDSYQQLTVKSILMLKWVAKRCPHAQFFLKADDDTFVNIGTIARILSSEPYISKDKFIGGHVKHDKPLMESEMDMYLGMDGYPMQEYPPYASGSAYMMSIPTALELFDATKEVEPPFFQQDDVFLTGLCAKHIDAPLFHEPSFIIDDPPKPPSWNAYSTIATAQGVAPDIFNQVWNDMMKTVTNSLSYFESAINSTSMLRVKKNV